MLVEVLTDWFSGKSSRFCDGERDDWLGYARVIKNDFTFPKEVT
jgi:hypothetical protein